jgi:serine/threonine protein kinase
MHYNSVSHRDLKPENIMLDEKFNIKFADFGFSTPIQGHDGSGFLRTILGTTAYMAPELIQK